jgi:uncharacterized protein (DUF983 family)
MPDHADKPPRPEYRLTEWEREWEIHKHRQAAERARKGPVWRAMRRGFMLRCPNCDKGRVLTGFLKPSTACGHCGEPYDHIRTDDFAPWLSILVIGHLLVPLAILVETLFRPSMLVHLLVWVPIGMEMVFLFLPRAKGLALGFMWAMGLRGDEHQY